MTHEPRWRFYVQSLWDNLTEPSSLITDDHKQRDARLLTSLLIIGLTVLLVGRLLRPILVVGNESTLAALTAWLNIVALSIAYWISRTPHYRRGAILAVVSISVVIYIQVMYRAYINLSGINLTAVWVIPLLFICSLVLSWRATFALAVLNLTALWMLPHVEPHVTFANVRPSLEIIATMSLIIVAAAIIRQRDLKRIDTQTRELAESENRYRTLMEASSEAVVVHDNGLIIDASQSFFDMFGYATSDIMGKQIMDIVAPKSVMTVHEKMGVNYPYELGLLRKDGGCLDLEVRVKRIMYRGRLVRVVTMHDITERKQVEAHRMELMAERERSSVLRQFIQDASHDLRTPLTTMTTSLYLLRRKSTDLDQTEPYLDQLDAQVSYLNEMFDDLFIMLQLDDPGLDIPRTPLDINPIVNDLAGDHRRDAAARGQTLRFEPGIDLPPVEVNETEIAQAITHIVSNALTYTPGGGTIVLRTRHENETVVIEIEDSGIGIGENDLPHIFKRFYRADQARQSGGHSGLGLAIAQRIIELQDGKIEVTSTLGQGSTFRIRLPVVMTPEITVPARV